MQKIEVLSHPTLPDLPRLGGKAANLWHLQQLGCRVPPFVVVPHDALSALLPQNVDFEEIKNFIQQFQFPENLALEILARFSCQLSDVSFQMSDTRLEAADSEHSNTPFFAVRSSGLAEDGTENSFAGQFETLLYVPPEGLVEAIRRVWLSAFGARVEAYSRERGVAWSGGISVIVQEMVAAEAAGVGFGVHPTEGWRDAVVLSAVYGLGEGLVSGELNADTFVVRGDSIEKTIVEKTSGLFYSVENQKVISQKIEKSRQAAPALSDAQILETTALLRHLNHALGRPQDIEFAYAAGQLYLLQTRPVTNLGRLPDRSAHRIVWDNSNIIESYPGVTTPLTFSFIIKMYEAVYRQMGDIMGVPAAVIERNQNVFANMLGLLRGRVYYNLESWYRALAMLPGYRVNARFMETMMGVKERFDLEGEAQAASPLRAWARLLWSVFRMLGLLVGLPAERRRFKRILDTIIADYQALDFDTMRPDEAMRRYFFFENFLLKKWKAPLVNDFFAMIYFGALKKQCAKIGPQNPSLHNDLLAGSHDIVSTEPVRRILVIAAALHADPAARAFFVENDAAQVWKNLGQFPDIQALVQDYLRAFGERTVGELKLETVTYNQNPAAFVAILQSYAEQPLPARAAHDEAAIRRRAEAEVAAALRFSPLKKWLFGWLLRRTRTLVSSRENLRYERTRGFGVVRRIFVGIGRQFAAEGILADARDIFYLSKEEIFNFIQGTAISQHLREMAEARKAEFEAYAAELPLPERITTFGTVYHANDLRASSLQMNASASEGAVLRGLGCSAGIVRGRVRVLSRPDELRSLEGDILVTASTDPGWVALFPSAAAILVERGSLLSHSAIVSRELGIPCVVGISGLLARLKTGDVVELNGMTGEVVVMNDE